MPDDSTHVNEGEWKAILPPVLMGLGAVALLRMSRLLSLALAGILLYDAASTADRDRHLRGRTLAARRAAGERLDAELADSFPASDSPSSSGGTAGAP